MFDNTSSFGYFVKFGWIGAESQDFSAKPVVRFVNLNRRGRRGWRYSRAGHHCLQSEWLEVVCCVCDN